MKQAVFNWFEMLKKGLLDRKFNSIKIDPCVFFRDDCIVLCYVNFCIIFTKKGFKVVDRFIHSLHNGPQNCILEDKGSLDKYLGVEVGGRKDGSIHLSNLV